MENEVKTVKANSKKKQFVIGIAVAAVLVCFGVVMYVKKTAMSDQERAIKKLFNALNNKDMAALDKITMPKEFITEENSYTNISPGKYKRILMRDFGIRDFLLNADYFYSMEKAPYFKDFYTFDPDYYGGRDKMHEAFNDPKRIKEVYKNFRLSYKIEDMCRFEDCNLYERIGYQKSERHDKNQLIYVGNRLLDVDDLYIAKVKLTWWWGNAKNGWNDEWLKDEKYNKYYGESHKKWSKEDQYGLYFVYKYEGNWYVSKEKSNWYTYERK